MEVNEVGRGLLMYIREGQDYDFSETELTTQVLENQTITMTTNENKKIFYIISLIFIFHCLGSDG